MNKLINTLKKIWNVFFNILYKIKRWILVFMGIMCLWYFRNVTIFLGYINAFSLIWVYIGALFILIAVFINKLLMLLNKTHKIVKKICLILLTAFLLSFVVVEGLIKIHARPSHSENADYLIVLGAGLYRGGPSVALLRRINAAARYSGSNPDVIIIVSGGRGDGQHFSEAEVMSRVLQERGVNISQIIIEEASANTYENIKNSAKIINDFDKKIVVVSSEFHLFRAKCLAKKMGFKNIGAIASWTPLILVPNYYLREYLAVMKDFISGNL